MILRTVCWVCLVLVLALVPSIWAQEGHPLSGTWRGDWGPSAAHRNPVTVVMRWDGQTVSGVLNPGPVAVPLQAATFDPATWGVRFEIEATDQSGNPVQFTVVGTLENYGSLQHQQIIGIWSHAGARGDFKITLQ